MMRHHLLRILILAITLASIAVPATYAVNDQVGTTSFPFLKLDIGSRQSGLGGAFTGLSDDVVSLFYNPAGIAGLENRQYMAMYHNYFADIQVGALAYSQRLGQQAAGGVFIQYLNYGDLTQTDLQGNRLGEFSGGDLMLGFAYASQVNRYISYGAAAKFLYQSIDEFTATGIAFDIGVRYVSDRERSFAGLSVQHIGTQLSSLGDETDRLPTTVRLGGGLRPRQIPVIGVVDLIYRIDTGPGVAAGVEYYELSPLIVRGGWSSFGSNNRTEDSDDSFAGFGVGIGLKVRKNLELSYSFSPAAELGESHRITFSGSW